MGKTTRTEGILLGVAGAFALTLLIVVVAGVRAWIDSDNRYRSVSDGYLWLAGDLGALQAHHARTGVWMTSTDGLNDDDRQGLADILRGVRLRKPRIAPWVTSGSSPASLTIPTSAQSSPRAVWARAKTGVWPCGKRMEMWAGKTPLASAWAAAGPWVS